MAFSLRIKRKAVLSNVLQKQRLVSKTYSIRTKLTPKLILSIFSSLSIASLAIFVAHQYKHYKSAPRSVILSEFKMNFHGNFPDSVRENIYKNVESLISQQKKFLSLDELAKNIQEKEGLSHVHVFQNIKKELLISVSSRTPIMKLADSNGKLISSEGDVYDDYNFAPKFQTTLSGVFPSDKQYTMLDERNCVLITEKEKKILLDAILLLNESEKQSFFYSNIEYKKYRGFFAKIKDTDTTVVFGYPPFDRQFARLAKILEEAKKRNLNLKNIEVDFNDKAFITESRK